MKVPGFTPQPHAPRSILSLFLTVLFHFCVEVMTTPIFFPDPTAHVFFSVDEIPPKLSYLPVWPNSHKYPSQRKTFTFFSRCFKRNWNREVKFKRPFRFNSHVLFTRWKKQILWGFCGICEYHIDRKQLCNSILTQENN